MPNGVVTCERWDAANDARGGGNLVCGVTAEIEPGGYTSHDEVHGPHAQAVQCTRYFAVIKVHVHPAELDEFVQFPQNDGGNRLLVSCQVSMLMLLKFVTDCENENVVVKIEHSGSSQGQ